MNKRPLSITIISWICIVFGSIALLTGLLPSVNATSALRLAELKGHWIVHLLRMLMILSGVLLIYGSNWGRWLLVVWLAGHVVISFLHTPFELIVHAALFALGLYLLFQPWSSAYFRNVTAASR